MKKWTTILACMACALAVAMAGCSSIVQMDSTKREVLAVPDGLNEPATWEKVGKEVQAGRDVVLKIRKGQSIPLVLTLVFPGVQLKTGENSLLFTRDVYLLISSSMMRISPDGQRWADIGDMASHRELFGFSGGDIAVGFSATKEAGARISVDVKTR
jgi:hypothetical protein